MAANILFILSDQHNAKVLGHQQHPNVKTPNLDRMAAEGVRFDAAITQNPICTPSRVSWLSGQYCHNHGYYGLSGHNPEGLPTVLGHFRRFGYATSAIGKIHCPEYWVEDDSDVFHETCNCSVGGRSPAYSNFLSERGKLDLEDHIGLTEFGQAGRQSVEGRPSPLTFEESQEGWIAAQTIAFMRESRDAGRPFFAHASLPRPHQCTAPSQEFWDLYEGLKLTLPPNADYEMAGKAPHMRQSARKWREKEWALLEPKNFEAARERKLRGYLGAVSQVDHAVGRMLEFLRESGLERDTVVIYSADHGDYACEHGIMEKAPGICADAITRIPFIWRCPERFKAGHVCRDVVEAVDMTATVCALASLEPMETSDGTDLSPMLAGAKGDENRLGVTEFAWSRSVRKGDYRMVFYPKAMFSGEYPDGFGELYDLKNDPWEMENLYFNEKHAGLVAEMKNDLLDWLVTTTRPATALGVSESSNWQWRTRHEKSHNLDGKIPTKMIAKAAESRKNYL